MIEKFCNLLKIKSDSETDAGKRNDAITLKSINKDKTISFLTTENDGKVFALTYT